MKSIQRIKTVCLVTAVFLMMTNAVLFAQAASSGNFFVDDFESGKLDNWDISGGTATIVTEGNKKALSFVSDGTTSGIVLRIKAPVWESIAAKASKGMYVEMNFRPMSDAVGDKNIGIASDITASPAFYYGGINFNNRYQVGVVPSAIKGYQNTSGVPVAKPNGAYRSDNYKIRYEISRGDSDVIMMYMNDIPFGKNDAAVPYTVPAASKISTGSGFGVYSCGASFILDDVRVGSLDSGKTSLLVSTSDLSISKLSGSIAYQQSEKTLRAGDTAISFTVKATKDDGSADGFTVRADSLAVSLSSSKGESGSTFTVTPVKSGKAVVTISNASNVNSSRTVTFNVGSPLNFVATEYGPLGSAIYPASGSMDAYAEDALRISFSDVPLLINDGMLMIYEAGSKKLVDTILCASEKKKYGSRDLLVGSQLVSVIGKDVVIIPHTGVLAAGKEYVVAIPDGMITAKLNGKKFTGFTPDNTQWHFTVRAPAAPAADMITVATSGPADFRSVQAALDYAASLKSDATVTLREGTYRENLTWDSAYSLVLKGASGTKPENVVVAFENCTQWNVSTDNRALFMVKNAPKTSLVGITLENTRSKAGINSAMSNQAETIYFNNATGSFIAINSRFVSRQDTILVKGFSWFYKCYITGDVDFIWGYPDVALFEACTINARLDDRSPANPSYVLQSRAIPKKQGFVFLGCNFTIDQERTVESFMARTGGAGTESADWDSVAVIDSVISPKFAPVLWSDDAGKKVTPDKSTASYGWREYGNKTPDGKSVDTKMRYASSYVLSESEYRSLYANRTLVLKGTPLESILP